jgi:hypothetical protein
MPKRSSLLNTAIALLLLLNRTVLYSLLAGKTGPSPAAPSDGEQAAAAPIQIDVLNGCGVNGVGNAMTGFCREQGYDVVEMGNYKNFEVERTVVIDRKGTKEVARLLAQRLGVSPHNVVQQFSDDHLVSASIVIGKDYRTLRPWNE